MHPPVESLEEVSITYWLCVCSNHWSPLIPPPPSYYKSWFFESSLDGKSTVVLLFGSFTADKQTDRHLLYPIDLFIAPLIRDYHPTPPIHVVCTTHTLEKSPLQPHFEFIVFPGNPRRSSLLEGRTSMCPINQIHHHGHGRPRWWAGHLIQLGLIPLISGNQLLMDKI